MQLPTFVHIAGGRGGFRLAWPAVVVCVPGGGACLVLMFVLVSWCAG